MFAPLVSPTEGVGTRGFYVMILALKQHLESCQTAQLSELVKEFQKSPDYLAQCLSHLVEKGIIIQEDAGVRPCGSPCGRCPQQGCADPLYHWKKG